MLAVVLALGASVGWGSADFLGGMKSRERDPLMVLATSQAIQFGLVLAAALIIGIHTAGGSYVLWAVLSAIVQTIGMVAYYNALSIGVMGIVAPLSGMASLVPLVAGLVGGEHPAGLQLLGVGFALTGLVLASYQPRARETRGKNLALGVGLALVAALGFGTFYLLLDEASDRSTALSAVTVNKLGALVLLWVGWAVVRGRRLPALTPRDVVDVSVFAGLALSATLLFAVATTKGLVSTVAVLGALYPVTTALLARLVLKERVRSSQRIGAASAVIGAALIAA